MLNTDHIDPTRGCYKPLCDHRAYTLAEVNNTAFTPGDDNYLFTVVLCKQHFMEFINKDHLDIIEHGRVQV